MIAATSHLGPIWAMSLLALAFTIKHFVADFLFQTSSIAHGKERRDGWLVPLATHVTGHAALTLLIALAVAPRLWWLALVDLVVHFAIDHAKTLASRASGATPQDAGFWWLLGLDQMLHGMTNIGLSAGLLVL